MSQTFIYPRFRIYRNKLLFRMLHFKSFILSSLSCHPLTSDQRIDLILEKYANVRLGFNFLIIGTNITQLCHTDTSKPSS